MDVVRRPDHPRLRPLVGHLGYYELAAPHGLERVLPNASAQLLINLDRDAVSCFDLAGRPTGRMSGSIVQGTFSTPAVIDSADQRSVVYVGFNAGGTAAFFGDSSAAYADRLVDLVDLWGSAAAVLRERLLASPGPRARLRIVEQALLSRLDDRSRPDPDVRYAAALLDRGAANVADAADRVGLTPRTLSNRFTATVGLRPKRFARVRRIQRLLRALPAADAIEQDATEQGTAGGPANDTADGAADDTVNGAADGAAIDWARKAVEHGFYDQAHLINEFRELTGLTPTTYHGRAPGEHNHVPL